jgi:hypothetical protein
MIGRCAVLIALARALSRDFNGPAAERQRPSEMGRYSWVSVARESRLPRIPRLV